jgi:lipopolysaccharide biosynthesis glycosyltransferase
MTNAKSPAIHVACGLDEGVLFGAQALAASIACHARPERPVVLHVLHSGLSSRIADALAGHQQRSFSLRLHDVGAAFMRLRVKRPFSAAFELMSAIPVGERRRPVIFYLRNILGIEYRGPASYFNSGVMLLNLDAWRTLDIAARCVAFIERFDYLQWPDQDALNVICGQRFLALDARWNAFARWCEAPSPLGLSNALTALQNDWVHDPWIVHFSGDCKPWKADHFRTVHDHLFWRYLDRVDPDAQVLSSIIKTER